MGVTGLWKLIEPCGKPVPVETLEGKILAVDISIWLHQAVKGFQDNKGSALNNAHLLGLFHRLCKLLYYRVKPVFIFDGCVPQLKRDTIARRQQQRSKLTTEADRIQALLLQSLAKEKVVQQALGTNAELLLKSPVKRPTKSSRAENSFDEIFKLPELPAADGKNQEHESDNNESSCTDDYISASATEDSSFDESNPRYAYNANLQSIDVHSQHFKNLPADIRHDILTDIKETRKQSSWGRLHELPSRSDDFSSFQMKRLLKRRAVQESLDEAKQEMGGRSLTYAELSNFFNEEGIITPSAIAEGTKQISSDENTRYLLVRDLKKKLIKTETGIVKCEPIKEEVEIQQETKTTKQIEDVQMKAEDLCKDELGDEFDDDLNLAIALSLEGTKVYDEKDYDYDSDQDLRLNREQSKQLRNAAKGPARAYMIEYGGMNEEEVENIMERTQLGDINDTAYLEQLLDISTNVVDEQKANIDDEEKPTSTSRLKANLTDAGKDNKLESQELNLRVSDESDTDSDLVEVSDEEVPVAITAQNPLSIVLDVVKPLAPQDDLFADIFETEADNKEQSKTIKHIRESKPTEKIIEIKDCKELPKKSETEATPIVIKDSQEQINEDKSTELPENKTLVVKPTADKAKMLAILDDLKKQTEEVKNLKLSTIKRSDSTIEISDDEAGRMSPLEKPQVKAEVIEICDSDDNSRHATTTETASKSPMQKTPSKNQTITEFFETAYFIKRTPDKPNQETSTPPKVKSPFFVKKTPKSARKHAGAHEEHSNEAASPSKKLPKAAKALFELNESATKADADEPKGNQVEVAPAPLNAEEIIKDAAEALKSQKTTEELDALAKDLAAERRELETERNRQDRMGMSISQRMNVECQELLRLFGVPFIVAPMEAEAQCAFLNAIDLTNGTITDDSDIWLFGGRTVYKNFFAQNKHVLEFRADQIEQSFNCDRKKLIQLACLVGSDYTTGVHGIGAVTALEILASFSCTTQDSPPSGDAHTRATIQKVVSTLAKFRDWWVANKNTNLPPGSSARLSLRKKLKNIELHDGFPSVAVVEAYLTPKIDDNKAAFSWGNPDVESIREFARKTFGWTTTKTDEILRPVLKKLNDKKLQGSLLNYFSTKGALSVRELKVSKRVQTAIDKMSGKIDVETPEKPAKTTRPRRIKRKAPSNAETIVAEKEENEEKPETPSDHNETIVKTSTEQEQTSVSKPSKYPRLPNTKEVIPQRERDLEQMRKNKEKAAEILKKSAAQTKKRAAKKS